MSRTSTQRRDLTVRTYQVRAESANREARTVEATIATDEPVWVFDMREWEMVREILVMGGLEAPDQVPLLDNHNRNSNEDVLGSTRSIKVEGGQLAAVNHFASDERSQRTFDKVADGHIRDNSVGYQVLEVSYLEPGESAVIDGKTYSAGSDRLRLARRWRLLENSITPIGADPAAKMRSDVMNDKAKKTEDKPEAAKEEKRELGFVDVEAEKRRAVRAEIIELGELAGNADLARQLALEGLTVEQARKRLLEDVTGRAKPAGTPEPPEPSAKKKDKTEEDERAIDELDEETLLRSLTF